MIPVTAVFDIGKTNKKFFLFDPDLHEVYHTYRKFELIEDEEGFECDDLNAITGWIRLTIEELLGSSEYELTAFNFSTYGATLVHVDKQGQPVAPLYNYLKPYPQPLLDKYRKTYGDEKNDLETASPGLGMLNSGLQLYWLKNAKPELFNRIHKSVHFPQYLSSLLTGRYVGEPTSVGCHTKLWDFRSNAYHQWLMQEGIIHVLPELVPTTHIEEVTIDGRSVRVGAGIHDSSSALASYQLRIKEPFLLLSTGTWSITLNAFTQEPLTLDELHRDCLNFLDIHGRPVKASRLFLGSELDHQLAVLELHFHKQHGYYRSVEFNPEWSGAGFISRSGFSPLVMKNELLMKDVFGELPVRMLSDFVSFEEAYHHVMSHLVMLQVASIRLALGNSHVRRLLVDGGFIDNQVFIEMLRRQLPELDLEVSSSPLGSALGAAMVMKGGRF
jgi:sugar (pentulose or hexulose) kinase